MNNWKETTLGEVAEFSQGIQIPVEQQFESKNSERVRFVRIVDYTNTGEQPRYIYNPGDRYLVKQDDLVMIRYGSQTAGKIVRGIEGAIANNTFKVSPKDALDKNFLYWFLKQDDIYNYLNKDQSSSTMPAITFTQVGNLNLVLPPFPEQMAIASILSSFDDKIELLRRQNKILENIAQTIYKQWFVKFKIKSEKLKVNSKTGLPEGWRIGTLGDVAQNIKDSVSKNNLHNHEHYIGLEHIERKHLALYNWGQADQVESNKAKFSEDDILFGKLRVYFHKVCFAPIEGICSTDILVIRPKNPIFFSFCLMWFFSENVVKYADAASTGTRMPRTSWEILSRYKVAIPDDDVMIEFNKMIKPIVDKIKQNIFSTKTLSKLRDTLLPKLMKGEIRVKNAS